MIRKALVNDSSRLAEIHVFGWRCAYNEFISMEHLINKMTVKSREEKWIDILTETKESNVTYVYEENNIVKGFMTIGDCRDEDKTIETFELWGIYIDPLFQRQCVGSKLVSHCEAEAITKRKKEIVLWVFEKNKNSIKFYNKMGFEFDGKVKLLDYFNENEIRMCKGL